MKAKAIISFNDLQANKHRTKGDAFEVSEERAKFLLDHNAIEIIEEPKEEIIEDENVEKEEEPKEFIKKKKKRK